MRASTPLAWSHALHLLLLVVVIALDNSTIVTDGIVSGVPIRHRLAAVSSSCHFLSVSAVACPFTFACAFPIIGRHTHMHGGVLIAHLVARFLIWTRYSLLLHRSRR
jgi:hypothetical protein